MYLTKRFICTSIFTVKVNLKKNSSPSSDKKENDEEISKQKRF